MTRLLKLDSMEIIGFKSFYGRTLFEFPEGITAVVGPNGCGKSNIGDAISWVLGEQKASSLRSDRMEDVIFNGSEGRRPLGMAEVSLHFKNLEPGGNGHAADHEGNGHGGAGLEDSGQKTLSPPARQSSEDANPIDGDLEVPIGLAQEVASPAEDAVLPGARFVLEEIPEDVVVTRRLYRSGESEYVLNGQRCRLMDIQHLLAKTQIGTRLYTTIEQGKIDQILASKPKERRAILEEAAGILGYKVRRRQAEQKLEAAQANLLRLSDITSEVEKQIGSLRRQAAKARRYRRLLEALRERRSAIIRRRLRSLDADRADTLADVLALRDSDVGAAAALTRSEADLEELRLRLERGEEASRARREAIHALDMEIDRLQARLRSGEEQAKDLEERCAGAGREVETLGTRAAELEALRADLDSRIAAETQRAQEAEAALREAEPRREERARAIADREAFLAGARAGLLRELDRIGLSTRERAALEEQIRAARASLERIEKDVSEARASLGGLVEAGTELEGQAAQARASRAVRDGECGDLAMEERRIAEELLTLERRAEEQKGRATALTERLQALREMERRRAGYGEGVVEILAGAAGFAPAGTVGERIDVARGLERAVAAVLEGILDAVIVSGAEEAARGVAHLRRRASGRAAFVPLGRADAPADAPPLPLEIEASPGVIGLLRERVAGLAGGGTAAGRLARVVLVETLEAALACAALCPDWAFVTAEGDIVRPDGIVVGGDGPALQHGILARRAEIEEIAGGLAETERERGAAEGALPGLRREAAGCRARLEEGLAGLRDLDRTILEIDLKQVQARGEIQKIEASMPLLAAERDRLLRAVDEGVVREERLASDLEAAEVLRADLEGAIRAASEALVVLRGEHEAAQAGATAARVAIAAGAERRSALQREVHAIEDGHVEVRAQGDRRAAEREEFAARLSALAGQAEASGRELETALAARAEAAARDEAAVAGLAYDRGLLHAREQAAKEGRAAGEARRRELQERELHLARLDADLEHLDGACRSDLGTTLEALRASPPAPDGERTLQEEEAEHESIKKDLDAMGPINLMAIEQYTELEERFNFLVAQKTDLDGSIASLRETIRKINRQSRERFLAAFDAIQEGFQGCFAALFGGGRAELRLEEGEEDVLEAGVEIAAQPPGKRLQTIALLSGGEKALTAVALLFSLFRYRPSPFCVLDEVDAPLDEANVERFTRLLQELRRETQFIVITHNRKSMEAADLLYGITMEEPGVSKVLPLHFE